MSTPQGRFDRTLYNRSRVPLLLASSAGSVAWSLAGRGASLKRELWIGLRLHVDLADRALPILNRN